MAAEATATADVVDRPTAAEAVAPAIKTMLSTGKKKKMCAEFTPVFGLRRPSPSRRRCKSTKIKLYLSGDEPVILARSITTGPMGLDVFCYF